MGAACGRSKVAANVNDRDIRMILRRFNEHLRNQDWFAVSVDLVVVVVGIYIGLQADAWRSAQQDRALEYEYLERLVADMDESIDAQRENIRLLDLSASRTDYIAGFQRLGSFEGVDEERLNYALNEVGWVPPAATNMVTIRELQSTGNISLIRDVNIRTAIGRFQRSYEDVEASAAQNRGFMSAAAPEIMTWSYMEPNVPGDHHSVTEAEDPFYGYAHHSDIERMLQNPDAARITSWVSGWSKYHGAVLMQHHNNTVAFRDLLRAKLAED